MADETESDPHASSQSIAQGTGHSAAPSPTRGHNENVSAVPPNKLPPQPQPDPTSPTPPTHQATPLESRPVNSTSSASSIPAVQATNAMDSSGPSPYGTRSRHRTGNSRPNYAEDRDIDGEYEWSTTKKSQAPQASTPSSQAQAVDSDKSSGINTRRSSTTASATPASKQTTSTTSKEQIPGMSSFSLNGENRSSVPPPTRKRKAPGSNAVHNSSASNEQMPAHGNARKLVNASASRSRETNMMSFEGSQAYLRNGKLEADDGTILEVDGMWIRHQQPSSPPWCSFQSTAPLTTIQITSTWYASLLVIPTTLLESWNLYTRRTITTYRSTLSKSIGTIVPGMSTGRSMILGRSSQLCIPISVLSHPFEGSAKSLIVTASPISMSIERHETTSGTRRCSIDIYIDTTKLYPPIR